MRSGFRSILLPSAVVFVFLLSASSPALLAQQNGVKRSLTLAELTYGENITAMAPAPNGNFWVGGYTCSNALPTTSNAIQKTWSGQPCVSIGFLERLLSDGRVDYLSYWGGSGSATITALATDATWNLYIGGSTTSADFATTAGAFARTCAGACTKPDGFVTKVSPDGGTVSSRPISAARTTTRSGRSRLIRTAAFTSRARRAARTFPSRRTPFSAHGSRGSIGIRARWRTPSTRGSRPTAPPCST